MFYVHLQSIDGNDDIPTYYAFSQEIKAFYICIKPYPSTPPFNLSWKSIKITNAKANSLIKWLSARH